MTIHLENTISKNINSEEVLDKTRLEVQSQMKDNILENQIVPDEGQYYIEYKGYEFFYQNLLGQGSKWKVPEKIVDIEKRLSTTLDLQIISEFDKSFLIRHPEIEI